MSPVLPPPLPSPPQHYDDNNLQHSTLIDEDLEELHVSMPVVLSASRHETEHNVDVDVRILQIDLHIFESYDQ